MKYMHSLPILALLAVVIAPTAFAIFSPQTPAEKVPVGSRTALHSFLGHSADGNFQAALDDAIKAAQTDVAKGGADMRVDWTLGAVTGAHGGITGSKAITVEIKTP